MSHLRVKICGVTRTEDALEVARLGADAIGFNFWKGSRRSVTPTVARAIARALPPFVTRVGVFVDADSDEILRTAERVGLDWVQLHGDESARFCSRLGLRFVKALRVDGPQALRRIADFPGPVLLDAPTSGEGRIFDWRLLRDLPRDRTVILAGGLTPANVARAVRAVRPYAVDVASGVERAPGIKDAAKMARFIRAARSAR